MERAERAHGGIIRARRDRRALALCYTGHEFGECLPVILDELEGRGVHASFFLTGDALRAPEFQPQVERLVAGGHYLGPHSDTHLLYCEWEPQRRTRVSRETLVADLEANLAAIERYGVPRASVTYFIPPYEHYNETIVAWCADLGLTVINYTPGTLSVADWTPRDFPRYRSTDEIYESIYRKERDDPHGLNGFLLLMHAGAGPGRPDKSSRRLGELLDYLLERGYALQRVDELLSA
ncbi:MAG TPA: polysaccharide deacetylase family protein [Chloroflexota bacterium]|nr:polysaccharide deacetylase family protein [Chloroflexota bacterium]